MKKTLLFFALLMATGLAQAQEARMDFIPYHHPSYSFFQIESKPVQQHDGDIVANVLVATDPNVAIDGNIFYKVSPTSLQYVDSLFVADTWPPYYMFAQDPRGDGNLRFTIESDGNGGTALRIAHFADDGLDINHADDVVVHLCDGTAYSHTDSYMVDSQGDLILKYYTVSSNGNTVCHIARYGLDGTLKHDAVLPASHNYITTMEEFESRPQRYFQWKSGDDMDLYIYQLDSSFQIVKQNIINHTLDGHLAPQIDTVTGDTLMYYILEQLHFASNNVNSTFVVPDGDDMLIATPFDYDSGFYYEFHECGAVVARYDMNNLHMKAITRFNDQPGPTTDVHIFSFRKNADGDFYLVYREDTPLPEATPTMTAVKMDNDLNVIWKRYCYEPNSFEVDPISSRYSDKLFDENGDEVGIYIFGTCYRPKFHDTGMFFFYLTEDAPLSVEE